MYIYIYILNKNIRKFGNIHCAVGILSGEPFYGNCGRGEFNTYIMVEDHFLRNNRKY